MEENTNIENENVETKGDGVEDTTTTKTEESTETVTMSKADYDKAIQSAEDKVRGKMSKTIKGLEDKIKELSPVEKTQEQLDLENRIAKLEESERAVADKQRKLDLQEKLSGKGLDKSLVEYLHDDVDVDAFSNIIEEMIKSRTKSNGYVPGEHDSDAKITPEDYAKMTYSQKVELQKNHPETFRRLSGRK